MLRIPGSALRHDDLTVERWCGSKTRVCGRRPNCPVRSLRRTVSEPSVDVTSEKGVLMSEARGASGGTSLRASATPSEASAATALPCAARAYLNRRGAGSIPHRFGLSVAGLGPSRRAAAVRWAGLLHYVVSSRQG